MRQGTHLRLQLATPDDAALISGWREQPGYDDPYQTIFPIPRYVLEKWLALDPYEPEKSGWWLIKTLDTDEPAGLVVHFSPSTEPHFHALEIGWEVRPSFRGRGFAVEAATLLVNYLFTLSPVERLQATIVDGNDASCRVAERIGMQFEGTCRHAGYARGQYVDVRMYSILRADWHDEESYLAGRPVR